jgi:hypothetical protein
MQIERSPFLRLDRQTVIGYFKAAGTRDPDVLHSHKASLVSLGKFPKLAGIYVMVMGGLLTITILGAFIGIPLLVLGWWMRRRGVRNLEEIEAGYDEYLGVAAPSGAGSQIAPA